MIRHMFLNVNTTSKSEVQKSTYLCFIHFGKVSDKLQHDKIFEFLDMIRMMIATNYCWKQEAIVVVGNTGTRKFGIRR